MNCNVRTTRQMLNSLVVAAVAAFGLVTAGTSVATPNDDATSTQATQDTSSALVQLNGDPLSTYVRTKPPQGKKIDFYSNTTKSYRAQLSALRNDYKQWLKANVPQAKVTGEFDISLNAVAVQLNGATLAQVAAGPQVKHAEYEGLYHPNTVDIDSALISAPQAWAAGGSKGDGVKIAIVDTGIDVTHPCFSEAGYTAQTQLGDKSFTNNKVIAAKVFNNKTPSQKYTPEALQDHGTHVAGTAACNENTPAPVNGVTTYDMSGVAPRALLGNYNVFPGDVLNARSEDIVNALEAAYADGFDVANMSLGGLHGPLGVSGQLGFQDLLTMAVDNLDQANMVVAVAAGNSGPGHYTIESPGSAARALTAGASTVGHFIGAPVTVGGNTYAAATGDFETVASDLTAPLAVTSGTGTNGLNDACSAFPAGSLANAIALVTRGTCTFSTKIRNAQDAGAVAVLVGNNVYGDPTAMAQDGTPNQPTIPAYMVSRIDAGALKAFDTQSTTIGATLTYLQTGNNDFMAGFSSQGPTKVDFRVKPDVVAPGVSVLSSIPHQFCDAPPCFAFFQGTSMATPHLAGSAAVVRGAHPLWSAAQVRSAVVNTADIGVLKSASTGNPVSDVNLIGSGRENLLSAVGVGAGLDPVSVSFGAVPSGSGQTLTFDVTVTNLSSSAANWSVAVGAGGGGVAYSVSPASVSLAPGAWTVVTITMTAAKGAVQGDHQATLTVGGSHGAVYTFIK
jgi:minor extracellular serine protease Vpr